MREAVNFPIPVFKKIAIFFAGMLALLLAGCGAAASPTNTPVPTAEPSTA
jgi:hypothetical protein